MFQKDLMRGQKLAPFTAVLACELEPGGSVGAHVQQEFPEIVVVIEGEGTIRVNGEPHPVTAGTVVPLPLANWSTAAPMCVGLWLPSRPPPVVVPDPPKPTDPPLPRGASSTPQEFEMRKTLSKQ